MTVQICRAATGPTACYAQRELKRYLRKYSGAAFGKGAELTFRLEVDESLPAHCYGWRWEESSLTLRGGSESALLCCVYQLLSQLGVCFSTEGDFLKKPFALGSLPESQDFSPYCRYRGVRQHINFPMDISAYPLGKAKEYIRRLARMGMNAITFHSYNGQWHPYHKGEERVPAGHFFYGQRHAVPADPELAAAVDNRRAFCIPEVEAILEEPDKRERFAVYWLGQVMDTAKEAGMRLTLSVECQESTPLEEEKSMVREVLALYPQIDVLELITPEGGGDNSQPLSSPEAAALCRELFGGGAAEAALQSLRQEGREPWGEVPSAALDGTLRSVKQIWRMWQCRQEWLGDKELQVGLYVTCKESLRVAKAFMNQIFPAELGYTFLPAHGALAVADAVAYMGVHAAELQKTMLYSWVEFDGNMYVQQNSCGGIQALLEYCRRESGGASIHGICFNHWRTAENSLTLSYAAQASGAFLPARDFYRQYAAEYAIGQPETFVELMSQLEELDIFNRDNLFNVGFCYLGCWLNPKGLGWIRRWERSALEHSIQTYQRLGEQLAACLAATESPWGLGCLRLWENRCACSVEHLRAIEELEAIAAFTGDAHPERLGEAEKAQVRRHCAQALAHSQAYQRLHLEKMPDRGCQGTLVSYWATIPVYIDHVLQYFAEGERECPHQPLTLDAPPPPDTAFFS